MKKVQIEFDELPFSTLERFGLTREMIEDLPMQNVYLPTQTIFVLYKALYINM